MLISKEQLGKSMGNTFIISDIHGQYLGLLQCLHRSHFDYDNDTLIVLGDTCDRGSQTKECFDELLKIKNLLYLMGNHDCLMLDYINDGIANPIWVNQGGKETLNSYGEGIPESHIELLRNAHYLIKDDKNRVFVHGGINLDYSLNEQDQYDVSWNREMWRYAKQCHETKSCGIPKKLQQYHEIYIGHTPVINYGSTVPLQYCNVWNIDTGAGYFKYLTIMNVDTHEYWQSDLISEIYKENNNE